MLLILIENKYFNRKTILNEVLLKENTNNEKRKFKYCIKRTKNKYKQASCFFFWSVVQLSVNGSRLLMILCHYYKCENNHNYLRSTNNK